MIFNIHTTRNPIVYYFELFLIWPNLTGIQTVMFYIIVLFIIMNNSYSIFLKNDFQSVLNKCFVLILECHSMYNTSMTISLNWALILSRLTFLSTNFRYGQVIIPLLNCLIVEFY